MQIVTLTKKELKKQLNSAQIFTEWYQTSAGALRVDFIELGIFHAKFELAPEHAALVTSLKTKSLLLAGTEFQIKVWKAALQIPASKTASYKQLAEMIAHPKAYRAVANALKHNPIGYFVPCHRVIKSFGDLCGYNGGIEIKQKLLEAEKAF